MKYSVGFFGYNKNNKNEVYPVTGWIVSPDSKEEKKKLMKMRKIILIKNINTK